jgi:hypothetical protein
MAVTYRRDRDLILAPYPCTHCERTTEPRMQLRYFNDHHVLIVEVQCDHVDCRKWTKMTLALYERIQA